jgi:hypothetical protein
MIATYSRVVRSGGVYGTPCHPSTTWGPDMPMPQMNLPPVSSCSESAVIAVIAGVRAAICITALPRTIRDV